MVVLIFIHGLSTKICDWILQSPLTSRQHKQHSLGNYVVCVCQDECTNQTHDCHEDANCSNTMGSLKCTCKKGFYGDGRNCSGKALAKQCSHLEPTRTKFTTSMELGIVWSPTWLELARVGSSGLEFDWNQIFTQLESSFHRSATPANSSQLSPSCFVVVKLLRGRIQTTEWFLASWLNLAVWVWPPADACFDFVTWLELAWIGSTVWPGLKRVMLPLREVMINAPIPFFPVPTRRTERKDCRYKSRTARYTVAFEFFRENQAWIENLDRRSWIESLWGQGKLTYATFRFAATDDQGPNSRNCYNYPASFPPSYPILHGRPCGKLWQPVRKTRKAVCWAGRVSWRKCEEDIWPV